MLVFFGNTVNKSQGHQRNRQNGDIHLQAENRDDPSRHGGTDIGSHNHTNRLEKRQQTRVHETHHHHRSSARRLYYRRDSQARKHAFRRIGRHGRKNGSQFVSGSFLQTGAHHIHTIKEHAERSQKRQNLKYHNILCLLLFNLHYFSLLRTSSRQLQSSEVIGLYS